MSPDTAASVRARLLLRAKEHDEEFELFLVRFAVERFLYRLGASRFRDRCILKGAALLSVWMDDPYRASRDVDLLARGASDEASIRTIVTEVCGVECAMDGLRFDLDTLRISRIREEDQYAAMRAVLTAYLGTARIRIQIDFGFGDDVGSPIEDMMYPVLLANLPAPSLRMYPKIVSIAEKFEAMVTFGRDNTRMKDFHDIWALSSSFPFDGVELRRAVQACFSRRGTALAPSVPEVLTSEFYGNPDLHARWTAYLRAGTIRSQPPSRFLEIGERVLLFLRPVRDAITAEDSFHDRWEPGGPWAERAAQ